MSSNKNATIRYQALDRCFRNPGKKYYYKDLLEACNEALFNFDGSEGIEQRQLKYDIAFMESEQGWSIDLDKKKDGRRVYLRYRDISFSINNQGMNDLEMEQLKSAMLVLDRFKGMPQFDWINELMPKLDQSFNLSNQSKEVISFENNEFVEGTQYIEKLFSAILYSQTLKIEYKSFKSDEAIELIFHPYLLKQYNNRWFLFGRTEGYEMITNLALDRIHKIKDSDKEFQPNDIMDMEVYFEDIIGVSRGDEEVQKIVMKADTSLAPYIKTKPLHGSQKKISENEKAFEFSIEVIPNFELEKMILSFGEQICVVEPPEFKAKIKKRINRVSENYD